MAGSKTAVLFPSTIITTAVSADTTVSNIISLTDVKILTVEAIFTYGSGGTTAKFWVQTRLGSSGSWTDVMNFAFTTSSGDKFSKISVNTALAAATAKTDASLADNTIVDGLLGDQIRVKYTTTGTYAGGTTALLIATTKS
jgi:hypothetical protein